MNPRQLTAAEISGAAEDGNVCPHPDCARPPTSGERSWDDRGPQQAVAVRRFYCPDGHEWHTETDGG